MVPTVRPEYSRLSTQEGVRAYRLSAGRNMGTWPALPFTFEDLGEQQIKNIARPVHAYRILPAAKDEAQAAPSSEVRATPALQNGRARVR